MTSRSKNYTRREFVSKPVAYFASAGLLSIATEMCSSEVTKTGKSSPTPKLIQRPLGKTGVSLPIVSMGVMNADAPGLIARSYELGIRHFDTAAGYQGGRNEMMLGEMIRRLKARDKVLIATKAGVHGLGRRDPAETKADFLRTFEGSLRRLQMDYVDILYVHGVSTSQEVEEKGVQDALAQLKKEGRVRFAGVSTHSGQTEVLNALLRGGFYEVALVAFNYTLSSNQALMDAMNLCASKGVGLIAMKTQAGGSRRRRGGASANQPINQTAALKWVLQNEYVTTAVPGFTEFEQIEEDMTVASNLGLTEKERDFLSNNALKASLEFCQQCGECVGTCPKRVEIPALMRTHMYAFQYSNLDQARFTLAEVSKGAGLDACRLCPECSASCANTVNIHRKVEELRTAWVV